MTAESLQIDIIRDPVALEPILSAWDDLAAAAACPGGLSGWQLAWWRTLAQPGSSLCVVVVRDGERVAGIAPYAVQQQGGRTTYRLLAAPMTHRVAPVARPEEAAAVLTAVAGALAHADPAPHVVALDGVDADAAWPQALAAGWPGGRRPWGLIERRQPAPYVDLVHDDYDAWLQARSKNFRQQARRFRRRLEAAGGTIRMTRTLDEAQRDVPAFVRLHHARWEGRGGSSLGQDVGAMLLEAASAMLADERFRLWIVEVDGEPVGAQLFLAAGEEALYWNGGFDEAHAELRPALLGLLAGIEDCIARGERRLDLGGGGHEYKLRLADGDRPLVWGALVPRGSGYLRSRASLLPQQLGAGARAAVARMPPETQERVRAARARLSR